MIILKLEMIDVESLRDMELRYGLRSDMFNWIYVFRMLCKDTGVYTHTHTHTHTHAGLEPHLWDFTASRWTLYHSKCVNVKISPPSLSILARISTSVLSGMIPSGVNLRFLEFFKIKHLRNVTSEQWKFFSGSIVWTFFSRIFVSYHAKCSSKQLKCNR